MKPNGKKLGVLGGMGSAASAEFLRILAAKAPAQKDQEHPVVYMIADSQIPDRTDAIFGKGPDPSEKLYQDLQQLADMGADVLAVPCNTAHYFIDKFAQPLPKPLIHIIDETVKAAKAMSPEGVWMISTLGTWQTGLYQTYAEKHDLPLNFPDKEQRAMLQLIIMEVKANKLPSAGTKIKSVVNELWKIKKLPIMTACTELPLAYAASGLPKDQEVSSLTALADACIKVLYE
jgi:aspartate racemase